VSHDYVVTSRGRARANPLGIDPVEETTASLYNGSTGDTPPAKL